jgi:ankyrin repeat protein
MNSKDLLILVCATTWLAGCAGSPSPTPSEGAKPDKAQVEAPDQQGKTALMRAIEAGNTFEVRRLIDQGANVNARTESGVTPLMNAAGIGNKEIVQILMEKGADVNARTPGNYTVLMQAALVGQTEITKVLLDAGADPTVKDTSGRTAADYAADKQHQDIVDLLKAKTP